MSVFDRGFLYGDSVFESLRSYQGTLFALDEHLARLKRSAERVAIVLPVSLATLARRNAPRAARTRLPRQLPEADAHARDGSLARARSRTRRRTAPRRVLLVTALAQPPAESYERGISAITYRGERPSDAAGVRDAKVGNYLLAVLAMRAARAQGAREALIEDSHGRILEGSASNLFAVFAGKLATAPESAAILPGITRGHVLELARAAGLKVELRAIGKSELGSAEEVFVCSAFASSCPVVSIDGHPVGIGSPDPRRARLLRAYRERAAGAG